VDTRVVTGDHTASHQSTTPLNFRHLENGRKKAYRYVYCENSEDLSVNLIETHPISRGFRLESSSNNTVLLSTCRSGQPYIDLTVAQYLFEQRMTIPFINGRAKCQTHRILQPRQLG
jgi:hypothetical protein